MTTKMKTWDTQNWSVNFWLRSALCLTAIWAFSFGLAGAQDFAAVEKRLGGAVEAGEITLAQATVMLQALKKTAKGEMLEREDKFKEMAYEIEKAVEAGELTKQDAEEKLIAIKKKMFGGEDKPGSKKEAKLRSRDDREMAARKERYMAFAREVEVAVKNGDISKEDAEAKLFAVRAKMFRSGEAQKQASKTSDSAKGMKEKYEVRAKRIQAALEAGKMSEEEADKLYVELRRRMAEAMDEKATERAEAGESAKTQDKMEGMMRRAKMASAQIKEAIENGDLSEEEGKERLMQLRKRVADAMETMKREDD